MTVPAARFRWSRWFAAMATLVALAIGVHRASLVVAPKEHSSWVTLLRDDLFDVMKGEVSPELVVRWTVVVMALCLVWIMTSLIVVAATFRRQGRSLAPGRRLAALFVCTGTVVASSTGVASKADAAVMPIAVVDDSSVDTDQSASTLGLRVDPTLVGTAVVSGLTGAGLALRIRARDRESRRRTVDGDRHELKTLDSFVSDEMRSEMYRAEARLREVVEIVGRLRDAVPDNEVRHVIAEPDGWYVVEFVSPVRPQPDFQMISGRSIRVAAPRCDRSDDRVSDPACPAMIHVGRSMSGDVWVSLDAYAEFAVDCSSDEGERVWRHFRDSMALAPHLESRGLVSDVDLACHGPQRSFRCGVSVADDAHRIGESIAVIESHDGSFSGPVLRRVTDGEIESGLKQVRGEWRLLPVDVPIRPVGTGDDDIRRVRDLLGETVPPIEVARSEVTASETRNEWMFMASVLGPPQVVDVHFEKVEFERGKAEELVIWLALHPHQRKRSLARTALWLTAVQDATFSNVTAAARRSLNAVASPPEGHAWVGITMSDDLPLAEGFVTDVEILRSAVDGARLRPEDDGIRRLREALQLVRGVPFAASAYTWSDGIGMSGDAASLVVRASSMMAEMCQEIGDISGVYWATSKGLAALPGHENLVAVRLRAHAEHGDRAAMKVEWESYRRALASEWGDAEPSTQMMDLWRRLGIG